MTWVREELEEVAQGRHCATTIVPKTDEDIWRVADFVSANEWS